MPVRTLRQLRTATRMLISTTPKQQSAAPAAKALEDHLLTHTSGEPDVIPTTFLTN